ncbi:hypothetical protein [Clostridium perfringens]|uniref:hypothetical protein n=1 Tax=Clostridium perfringens TaxID=1502 RepID=UPI0018E4B083|nr:hypothetical protein [Clostridium perfringens]MBI5987320.1 hypothetical protein [Clostridium perfringens]MBI6054718.1 hypothetical protein [Clostridium perfringens]MDM0807569.1 hypothetical protein [Clostridium perfringens]MDZ4983302.1 hypothetical protein [Clostridium perfringens]
MSKLIALTFGAMFIKTLIFLIPLLVLKFVPKKKYCAEEVIACKFHEPKNYIKEHYDDVRNAEVERYYNTFKQEFKSKLQAKEITRAQVLQIKNYLRKQVYIYPKKHFANDAHAIYTMLLAQDLTIKHLNKLQKILDA